MKIWIIAFTAMLTLTAAAADAQQCNALPPYPTAPSATAPSATFTAHGPSDTNWTLFGTVWREPCPSNPATSIIYLRATPTSGQPFFCVSGQAAVIQNGNQYSSLMFSDGTFSFGNPLGNVCEVLLTPVTVAVQTPSISGMYLGAAFDPNQALTFAYNFGTQPPGLAALPAAGATTPASITPQIGMWWNPAESGSGYALDYKHGVLVVTVYSYTTAGVPIWYLASGAVTNNTFTSTLDKYQHGQCVSCTYQPATINGNDGNISITFTSPTTATMSLPGGRSFQIVPQAF